MNSIKIIILQKLIFIIKILQHHQHFHNLLRLFKIIIQQDLTKILPKDFNHSKQGTLAECIPPPWFSGSFSQHLRLMNRWCSWGSLFGVLPLWGFLARFKVFGPGWWGSWARSRRSQGGCFRGLSLCKNDESNKI